MEQRKPVNTMRFTTVKTALGFKFIFSCALCRTLYESDEIKSGDYKLSNIIAADSARRYFNRCHKCGEWVCDKHYDEDTMRCLSCSPRADRSTIVKSKSSYRLCRKCRFPNEMSNCFCQKCGSQLLPRRKKMFAYTYFKV